MKISQAFCSLFFALLLLFVVIYLAICALSLFSFESQNEFVFLFNGNLLLAICKLETKIHFYFIPVAAVVWRLIMFEAIIKFRWNIWTRSFLTTGGMLKAALVSTYVFFFLICSYKFAIEPKIKYFFLITVAFIFQDLFNLFIIINHADICPSSLLNTVFPKCSLFVSVLSSCNL